jgi:peptidoglycan/LPS O-acetylase OafA/YrhL
VPTPVFVRKPALPALSGLRTILAVNVMFFHFTPPHPDFLSPVIDNAYVFVGFFFLISGFVLAYNYADRPTLSKRAFYVARFSRIYPVYLLVLALSFPFVAIEFQAHSRADFFTGLVLTPLMLQSWSPTIATFWNTVAWTVPAELFLYVLFPYLLRGIDTLNRRYRLFASPARIMVTIAILWAIGILPHTFYLLLNPDHLAEPATRYTYGFWLRTLKYSPAAYFCTFTAGVLVARLQSTLELTPRRRAFLATAAVVVLGLFFAFAVGRIPYVIVHGCLLLPIFATLILGLAGANPVSAVFAWRPIVFFGETTFALYLLHFNAILLLQNYKVTERLHLQQYDPWISFAFVMVLAILISRFWEKPARKTVMRWLLPLTQA